MKKYPDTKRLRILSGEVSSSVESDNNKQTWTIAVNGNAVASGLRTEDAVRLGVAGGSAGSISAEKLPFARVVQKNTAGTWRTIAIFPTDPAVLESVFDASKSGDSAKLEELLKVEPGFASIRDATRGATPLHYAAASNKKLTVDLLLSQGADVNAKDNDGKTPLHWAAEAGAKSTVRQLLAHKADMNAKDNDGKTPGQLAAGFRIEDIEALLLANLDGWTLRSDLVLGEFSSDYESGSASFSSDASHFAYKAGRQGNQKLIVDGHVVGTSEFFNSMDFAPVTNELHYFVVRSRGSGGYTVSLVAGGKEIPVDVYPGSGAEVFSPDGKHYAAVGGNTVENAGGAKPAGVSVVIDGNLAGKFLDTNYPVFFPSGSSYAQIVLNHDETMSLIVDGKITKSFPKPTVPCSFVFNISIAGPNLDYTVKLHVGRDGHMSYLVRDDMGWSVYLDDKRVASYGGLVWGSPPSHILSYEGSNRAEWIVENSFVAAKNGSSAVWWATTGGMDSKGHGEWRLLLNGEPRDKRSWKSSWAPRISPRMSADGNHIAYAASLVPAAGDEEHYVVLDDKQFGPYADVWALALSEDGAHVAYAAKAKGASSWQGYLDGNPLGETFEDLYGTAFTPGTSSVAWIGERSGSASVILNGVVLHQADHVLFGPVFPGDGLVKWVLQKGNSLVEVTAERD